MVDEQILFFFFLDNHLKDFHVLGFSASPEKL